MNLTTQLFTVGIGLASVYFFYEFQFFIAAVLFTWFLSRLFGHNLKKILDSSDPSSIEKKPNVHIEIRVNIIEVLNHAAILDLFDKLKDNEQFANKFKNKSEWVDTMIENYKRKYKNAGTEHKGIKYLWHTLHYNINNNTLWRDDKIDFTDSIEYELFIPYEYNDADENETYWHGIRGGLRLRVLMVNGQIRVQVGKFDRKNSPEIYQDSSLGVYKTWETITKFPFMYISQSLPVHYLNFSFYASDSYKDIFGRDSSMKKDRFKDWRELNAEIIDYNYLEGAFSSDELADIKFSKVFGRFHAKGKRLLEAEKFVDPYKRNNDDWVPGWMEDHNVHYNNEYFYIDITDRKAERKKLEQYYWPDFHEELP